MMRKMENSRLFKLWMVVSTLIVLISVGFIIGYIVLNGIKSISLDFIISSPKGLPLGSEGGILPAIVGSLLLMLIACGFASFLALATAIYVVFYCQSSQIENIVHIIVQCMAGVPSIVIGLFGYTFLVAKLGLGRSLLSAGLTLGVMVFPFIEVRIEKSLQEFSTAALQSSYALGVSKAYTLFKLVLPQCKEDIVAAITLAGGFAMGATAPIILTGAVIFAPIPSSLSSPVMALPFHLYILTGEGISLEKAYATALVLITLIFAINIISIALTSRRKEVGS
ncbi:MAG TPA: ABC transporter permease subunit [Firmicutes bacterium]|nr:ABC transporter permease subunit [Bacillota bacterium]